ncbi:MAG: metalloregulator ArsR/SmtB family transcription factor [Alphaproteobacteria bacterium]|nr:metalloregulator ArsR/SmtB family transcription factor [Alphaproteobacteria bacterium]
MDELLSQLRAAAEPTRLRLLALCARGALNVTDMCAVLGQSQPRLSRHLKLLVEARLLERIPEGANAYFQVPAGAAVAHLLLARLPEDDAIIANDRRQAARIAADHARTASEAFRRDGADWDEMRALNLPAARIEAAIRTALPTSLGRLLDVGTGTGRLLELLADRVDTALGLDASREMLALARARLAERGLARCSVRQADMYRLPLADRGFDTVTMQMVLHYAEDPATAIAEAGRVLAHGGRLLVVDFAPHQRSDVAAAHAHRWRGFDDAQMQGWFTPAGCHLRQARQIAGPIPVRLWLAERVAAPVGTEHALQF